MTDYGDHVQKLTVRQTTKEDQENMVGRCLADAYGRLTGEPLENQRRPANDPPDLIFTWRGARVGAELVEVEQFYDARALFDVFVTEAYAAFGQIGGNRYRGVRVFLPLMISLSLARSIRERLKDLGVSLRTAAWELAVLVTAHVDSRASLPDNDFGRMIKVDGAAYPALACLVDMIVCSIGSEDDVRPSPELPFVQIGGAVIIDENGMIASAARMMREKISGVRRWAECDHRILVIHDFPRGKIYQNFMEWEPWLKVAADETDVLGVFDEVWLVPAVRGDGSPIGDGAANAIRIAGGP